MNDDKFAYMVTPQRALELAALASRAGRQDIVEELRLAKELWERELGYWDECVREPY